MEGSCDGGNVSEKNWEKTRKWLPKGYRWEKQLATKKNKKGKAMGEGIIGVREEEGCEVRGVEDKGKGVLAVEIRYGEKNWRIVKIYINGDMEKKIEMVKGWIKEQEEGKWTLIGEDFNARTENEGGGNGEGEEGETGRKSKDRKLNAEGRKLVEEIGKVGWGIFNGSIAGDERGGICLLEGEESR